MCVLTLHNTVPKKYIGIECNEKVHLFDLHSEFQTTLTYFFYIANIN